METLIIVRDVNGAVPYWASGDSLPQARKNYKKFSGKFPSKKASIIAFEGHKIDIEKIWVNDLGDVSYPKTVTKIILQ